MLSAQQCRSADHNELLFIIQHQTSELWMKLVRHELVAARERLRARDLQPAFKMLARVSKVMAQLVHAWDVLATMTPSEYSAMRPALGSSSGLQSWQYRLIALLLGDRNHDPLASHRSDPTVRAMIEDELRQPSIYEVALEQLSDNGLLSRPATARPSPEVEAAWLKVYRHPAQHWTLYQLAEELIDLEDAVRQWRFRHVTTVERIIGFKPGTGGSDGVPYLRRQLEVVLFPELWSVRTQL